MRPAECLENLDLEEGWHVDSIIHRPPTSTGGRFSVGYHVTNQDGRTAYLKALDFSEAFQVPDPARALEAMTKAYNYERDLLAKCKDRRLNRVVTPLADGSIEVPGGFGPLGNVSYLIFELASGDIRSEVANWQQFDIAWSLRSLHQTALGLWQLHSVGVAHQDLKPSNILVFPEEGSKVADLGRASYINNPSPVDAFKIPGDVGYASPEQWYGWRPSGFDSRFLADLYHLGSLIFFYFARCSATQAIRHKIDKAQGMNLTGTDFIQDLPYIQHAFSEARNDLSASIKALTGDSADEIIMIVTQLCEPDPRRRGDPKVLESRVPPHDLQPYISRFDRLAERAEMRLL